VALYAAGHALALVVGAGLWMAWSLLAPFQVRGVCVRLARAKCSCSLLDTNKVDFTAPAGASALGLAVLGCLAGCEGMDC